MPGVTRADLLSLRRICQRRLRSRSLAEDAAQEAALAIFKDGRALPSDEPSRSNVLRWWARWGCARVLRSELRAERPARAFVTELGMGMGEEAREGDDRLETALARLSPPLRRALEGWAGDETAGEAARRLGVTEACLWSRVRAALRLLRRQLPLPRSAALASPPRGERHTLP